LLRIIQEAFTNILKHARASHVWVELHYRPEELVLSICDDGQGLEPQVMRQAQYRGLRFMRERAEGVGGSFELKSEPGQGTWISVKVPLAAS